MTIVRARYFPAIVQLPDEGRPRRRVYIVLAEGGEHAGMHVFGRPADVADWHAPIDWAATVLPSERGARNGVDVRLTDGRTVVVTASQGCKCGPLGRWAGPGWATTVAVTA